MRPSSSSASRPATTPRSERPARDSRVASASASPSLRDAPLLILDEATSQLDEVSEAAITEALDRLVIGRTVLLIAHRLRLAQRADRVVVLESGRVVEAGVAADLLMAEGPYRRLVDDHGHGGEASETDT